MRSFTSALRIANRCLAARESGNQRPASAVAAWYKRPEALPGWGSLIRKLRCLVEDEEIACRD